MMENGTGHMMSGRCWRFSRDRTEEEEAMPAAVFEICIAGMRESLL